MLVNIASTGRRTGGSEHRYSQGRLLSNLWRHIPPDRVLSVGHATHAQWTYRRQNCERIMMLLRILYIPHSSQLTILYTPTLYSAHQHHPQNTPQCLLPTVATLFTLINASHPIMLKEVYTAVLTDEHFGLRKHMYRCSA